MAWRAYRAYKAVETLSSAIAQAQEDAQPDNPAQTQAQAKADNAASAECKDCTEDPNCEKWRQAIRRALYGAKQPKELGGTGGGDKGLVQRLCELVHGNPGNPHKKSIEQTLRGIKGKWDNLENPKKQLQFRCRESPDLEKQSKEYTQEAARYLKVLENEKEMPLSHQTFPIERMDDFKNFCYQKALSLAQQYGVAK